MKPFRFIATPIATALAIAFAATGIAHSEEAGGGLIAAAGFQAACSILASEIGAEKLEREHDEMIAFYLQDTGENRSNLTYMAFGYGLAMTHSLKAEGATAKQAYFRMCVPGKAENG